MVEGGGPILPPRLCALLLIAVGLRRLMEQTRLATDCTIDRSYLDRSGPAHDGRI